MHAYKQIDSRYVYLRLCMCAYIYIYIYTHIRILLGVRAFCILVRSVIHLVSMQFFGFSVQRNPPRSGECSSRLVSARPVEVSWFMVDLV